MGKKSVLAVVLMAVIVIGVGCRNKPPQIPVKPIGTALVNLGDTAQYRSVTTDPNRDRILYIWDWGDGKFDTSALLPSGDTIVARHLWEAIGTYPVRVRAKDDKGNFSAEWSDTLLVQVILGENLPPVIGAPIGPDSGWVGEWQIFKAVATDPNGDSVRIKFLWDEGQTSLLSPLVASGDTVTDSVKYFYRGIKNIRCVAWDKTGLISDTSPVKVFTALQTNTAPPAPTLRGPNRGIASGPYYRFYARTIDPQGDRVRYKFIWGDGRESEWTPFQTSGGIGMDSVRFTQTGTYRIRAIAQDSLGLVSETSAVKSFTVVGEGELLWGLPAEEFVSSPAFGQAVRGSEFRPALIVGGTDERLYAYDPYQAETLFVSAEGVGTWEEFLSSPAIGPDGTIYIGNENGRFYAFNTSGNIKWGFPDTLTQNAFSGSAAVDGNIIYIAGEDKTLRKLQDNGTSWTEIWNSPLPTDANSSPVILPDGRVVVVDDSGYVTCVSANGSLSWQTLLDAGVTSSPAVDQNGNIYIGTDQGDLISLTSDGNRRWTYHVSGEFNDINSSPVIDNDGNIYFGCENGRVYKLNPAGSFEWDCEVWPNASLSSTPLLTADGVLYIAGAADTTTEKIAAININNGTKLWETTLTLSTDHKGSGSKPRRLFIDLFPSPVLDQYGIIYIATTRGIFAVAGRPNGYLMPSAWPMFRHDIRHTGKFGAFRR
ncbi:MAG: PQQ-binding-like beta-propeller repeat protein [candidate division WOR-3 bacterium]|jgi:outer membrane protein assembly factor BamB|nr:PQQ-binding-like beta-propeller repeat protein [candidate division WOR-3 bacterium]MCR4423959.1 PQQ-binding-like beta-propeller repeat protein [candidate division WOR-3 bacterium]MDH7519622.1 PQQ-binding-like beta-propeller repeat protein [bacterium]